jgi:hypothetical protein
MKKNLRQRIWLAGWGLFLISFTWAENLDYKGQLKEGDSILLTAHKPDAVLTFNTQGVITWRSQQKWPHPQQISALKDGRVFCAHIHGARMLNVDASKLWDYKVPKGCQNATALALDEQTLLVAHEGKGELAQISNDGQLIKTINVTDQNHKNHGQFRYLGLGPSSYLVPMTALKTFLEIDRRTGEKLWQLKLPTVTSALRHKDGSTTICYKDHIARYNAQREEMWKIKLSRDFDLKKVVPPVACLELEGGNLLVALWHKFEDLPDVIEVSPYSKTIVHSWSLDGIKQAAGLSLLPKGHPFSPSGE